LHFLTVSILYFILSFSNGWIPLNAESAMLFLPLFVIVYTIIWVCFYLYFKNESKKLNDELKKFNKF